MCKVCLFTSLSQDELQQVQHLWNSHRIRQSRNAVAPNGRPLMMYHLPQLFGAIDYLKPVSQDAVDACREECLQRGPYSCDETVFTLSCLLMEENHLHPPTTPDEAIELYMFLRSCIVANL